MMEYDIHTVLDLLTLIATVWVIYTLRIPLKDTYQEEQDSVQTYYVVRYALATPDAPDACTQSNPVAIRRAARATIGPLCHVGGLL